MGAYKYIKETWKNPKENLGSLYRERLLTWRKEPVTIRIEKPTRIDRARTLGYKAKPGFVVIRSRIRTGGRVRPAIKSGRNPGNYGRVKYTPKKNRQLIAEERVQRKFPNLEVLNSYEVMDDSVHTWYEVILVDPYHPAIRSDKDLKWIAEVPHKGRVHRGKTSAGKKARGMHKKGTGTEKIRPSIRSNNGRGK